MLSKYGPLNRSPSSASHSPEFHFLSILMLFRNSKYLLKYANDNIIFLNFTVLLWCEDPFHNTLCEQYILLDFDFVP